KVELGKVYGDFANGTAVEAIQVPAVNHISITWSPDAADTMLRWLDSSFGINRTAANLAEPRLSLILIGLGLFILLLIPIGRTVAGRTPVWMRRPVDRSAWMGLLAILIALLIAMALNVSAPQAMFLSIYEGNAIVSWLAIAGAILLLLLAIERPQD